MYKLGLWGRWDIRLGSHIPELDASRLSTVWDQAGECTRLQELQISTPEQQKRVRSLTSMEVDDSSVVFLSRRPYVIDRAINQPLVQLRVGDRESRTYNFDGGFYRLSDV